MKQRGSSLLKVTNLWSVLALFRITSTTFEKQTIISVQKASGAWPTWPQTLVLGSTGMRMFNLQCKKLPTACPPPIAWRWIGWRPSRQAPGSQWPWQPLRRLRGGPGCTRGWSSSATASRRHGGVSGRKRRGGGGRVRGPGRPRRAGSPRSLGSSSGAPGAALRRGAPGDSSWGSLRRRRGAGPTSSVAAGQ